MKRGGTLLAFLVACGGAKDATPVADVKPAVAPSPCSAARAAAAKLAAEGRLGRALRMIAEADGLCPARAPESRALRERLEKDLELGPGETGDSLVAAADKASDPAAARRLHAKAAIAYAHETSAKPSVAIENGLAGRTEFAEMAWAGDGSLFYLTQGKTLIGLDPQGWSERFVARFDEDVRSLDAVPRTPTLLVVAGWSESATTYFLDATRGIVTKRATSGDLRPVLSPDGTRAVLVGHGRRALTVVSLPDGATLGTIAPDSDREPLKNYGQPIAWTRDGKHFTVQFGEGSIGVYTADGKVLAARSFAPGLGTSTPAWQVSEDTRWLLARTLDAKRRGYEWRVTDLRTGADTGALAASACKEGDVVAIAHASARAAVWVRTIDTSRLCVFDIAKARLLGSVDVPDLKRDKRGKLVDLPWTTGVAFSPDDKALVVRTKSNAEERVRVARADGSAWIKDPLEPGAAAALAESAAREGRVDEPALVALRSKGPLTSPDGRSTVTRTKEGVLHAVGPGGAFTSPRPAEAVTALRFVEREGSSRPAAITVGGYSGSVRRLDLDTGRVDVTLDGDDDGYRYPLALDARGMAATFDEHYVVDPTKVRMGNERRLYTGRNPSGNVVTLPEGFYFRITESRAALDAEGGRLVVVTNEDVHVWDVATARETRSFQLPRAAVAIALSADGSKLAITTKTSPLQMWDIASGTAICSAPDDETRGETFGAIALLGPRGDTVVTRSYHGVSSWRADTCAAKDAWSSDWNDSGSPRRMAVSDDGGRVVVIGSRKLWILDGALKPVRSVPAEAFDETLAIANDGTIAIGRENGTIDVLDPGGSLRFTLLFPRTKPAAAGAVAPDGRFRALGDEKTAGGYLSCRFGTRAVPLAVCADALEDKALLSP